MKNKLLGLTLIALLCAVKMNAQEKEEQKPSVEKEIIGVQAGLGVWAYYEFKMANQLTLRTEAGLNGGVWFKSSFYGGTEGGLLLTPIVRAEPRWYYNLNRRVRKGKDIKGNRANYLSLDTSFAPDWFVVSTNDDYKFYKRPIVSVIPTWGIRRTLGKHFDYETGVGLGYSHAFKFTKNGYTYKAQDGAVLNLRFRIGYHF